MASYSHVHKLARERLPRECFFCGTTHGKLDCALIEEADPSNLRVYETTWGTSFTFSANVEDYVRMCRKCHKVYDGHGEKISAYHKHRLH